ncbi:MAG TPA: hypothetical protein VEP49_09175 [Acidimicrobiia bacterium]|nr:hypothetical protein [Acidimicrobiia bacterium]
MPERYELRFEQPDGVGGAVRLEVADDRARYWMYADLGRDGFVAIRHDDVAPPRGTLLEVRGDGLWAEVLCEVPGEHWTLGLEAFGLRLADRDEARTATVGERLPVGFDLEWDGGRVVGELLVGRSRYRVDGRGAFTHTPDATPGPEWAEWLSP